MGKSVKSITILVWNSILSSFGGIETQIYYISNELQRRGWKVQIVTPDREVINPNYINDKTEYVYYKVEKQYWKTVINCLKVLLKGRKTSYILTRGNFIHMIPANLIKLFWKVKHIWWICLNVEVEQKYQFVSQNEAKSFLGKVRRTINSHIIEYLWNYSRRKANYIVTQSNYQINLAKKQGYSRVFMIKNMHMPSFSELKKEDVILWSGQLAKHKRPEKFIEIVNKMNGSNYKFIMVGRFIQDFPEYKQMIEEIVNPNFKHIHSLELNEMLDLFAKATIYINTSNFEGFPNNFIQSWLCKTIVYSLDLDPDEMLSKDKVGKLYYDIDSMIADITNYDSKASENIQIINQALIKANNEFNIPNQIDKLEEILFDQEVKA